MEHFLEMFDTFYTCYVVDTHEYIQIVSYEVNDKKAMD